MTICALSRDVSNHRRLAAVGAVALLGRYARRDGDPELQWAALKGLDAFCASSELRLQVTTTPCLQHTPSSCALTPGARQVCASLEGIGKVYATVVGSHAARCLMFFLRLTSKLVVLARSSLVSDLAQLRQLIGAELALVLPVCLDDTGSAVARVAAHAFAALGGSLSRRIPFENGEALLQPRVLDALLGMATHKQSDNGLVPGTAKRGTEHCVKGGILEGALAALQALGCLAEDVGWGVRVKDHILHEAATPDPPA